MRPRLAVPGVIELVPTFAGREHEIVRGELAGYSLREDVTSWKNSYTFVALEDLSLEERLRFAPRFAEVWRALAESPKGYRDGAPLPHLTRLLSRATLLLVGSTDRRELGPAAHVPLDGPHRVFEVGFMRTADDYFQVRAARGKEELASVSGAFYSILSQVTELEDDDYERDHLADRVLRAATGGLVDGTQLAIAFMMTDVVSAEAWESYLAQAEVNASSDRELAEDVVRAIESAGADSDTLDLPSYGAATRMRLPARTIRSAASKNELDARVSIGSASSLELPAEELLIVETDDEPMLPRMPRELFPERLVVQRPRSRRALVVFVVLVVLAIAIAAAIRRPT